MAISAANAPDDSRDAAPAAIRNLKLRIGFVLLSGEADEASHQKLTAGRCHQILKRHLTLIFKVDNLRRFFGPGASIVAKPPQSLIICLRKSPLRHGRAYPGHPCPLFSAAIKTWMPAASAGMTNFSRKIQRASF